MPSPIGLKLGGDLWLVSQISVHVLVSRFDYFLYCKQTKEQINAKIAKITVLQNLRFFRRFMWYVCFIYIIVCLHFVNVIQENTLYGSFGCLRVKSFETWWMSSPKPNTQS
jgi:hypothetical protein